VKITIELHGGPRDGEKVTVSKGATEYNVKGSENDGAYVVKEGRWVWESNRGRK
jgi:hypothetical protein